jgi:hypothetical protein
MTTSPEFSLILVLWLNMEQLTQEEENKHEKRNAVEGAVPAHTHTRDVFLDFYGAQESIPWN